VPLGDAHELAGISDGEVAAATAEVDGVGVDEPPLWRPRRRDRML